MKGKVRGLFAVCGNLGRPPGQAQVEKYIDKQLAVMLETGKLPAKVFGGRMTTELLSEKDYKVLEEFGKKENLTLLQNYDNLARLDCLQFGQKILTSVK
jgi:hypothetical protein